MMKFWQYLATGLWATNGKALFDTRNLLQNLTKMDRYDGCDAKVTYLLITRSSSFKFGPASLGRNLGFSGAAIPLDERAAPVG